VKEGPILATTHDLDSSGTFASFDPAAVSRSFDPLLT
jgi:hypothetical protein